MSTSNTITKTDLENIINAIFPATTEDMTQAQIDAFIASLNATGINVADYVVEQGSKDGWYYRKWNSGKFEAWTKELSLGSSTFSAWGNIYYHDYSNVKALPFTLLYAPIVWFQSKDSQAWLGANWGSTTTNVGTVRMLANGSASRTPVVNIYVYGTWK